MPKTAGGAAPSKSEQETCEKDIKDLAKGLPCQADLKKFMCMAGARPCIPGDDKSKDTRSSVPCAWCQNIVKTDTNGCSSKDAPFTFKTMYGSDEKQLCVDFAAELKPQADTINAIGFLLDKDSLKSKRGKPAPDIVGMLSWGFQSALNGCSPSQCVATDAGMATGLWSTESSFTNHVGADPPAEDETVKGSASSMTMSATATFAAIATVIASL